MHITLAYIYDKVVQRINFTFGFLKLAVYINTVLCHPLKLYNFTHNTLMYEQRILLVVNSSLQSTTNKMCRWAYRVNPPHGSAKFWVWIFKRHIHRAPRSGKSCNTNFFLKLGFEIEITTLQMVFFSLSNLAHLTGENKFLKLGFEIENRK